MRISTRMHGAMDYFIGIVLLLAPNLLGFADVPASASIARIIGTIVLLQAVMTRFEFGLIKLIPMRMHLMMDYVIGAILAASPWLFGFSDAEGNAVWPHVIVGLLIIAQAAMTRVSGRAAVHEFDNTRRAA